MLKSFLQELYPDELWYCGLANDKIAIPRKQLVGSVRPAIRS